MQEFLTRYLQGVSFKTVGPFLVADLAQNPLPADLKVGPHGMEDVPVGTTTEPHHHDFHSFYQSSGLDVVDVDGQRHELPAAALTLVFPGVQHHWISKRANGGQVGSLDHRHEKQVVRLAA